MKSVSRWASPLTSQVAVAPWANFLDDFNKSEYVAQHLQDRQVSVLFWGIGKLESFVQLLPHQTIRSRPEDPAEPSFV